MDPYPYKLVFLVSGMGSSLHPRHYLLTRGTTRKTIKSLVLFLRHRHSQLGRPFPDQGLLEWLRLFRYLLGNFPNKVHRTQ